MTVPTVAMMPKKKNGAYNRGKRNRGTEEAFAETLRYLADDWGRLSLEELARFLCEYCQSNPEINAFCRTIALHSAPSAEESAARVAPTNSGHMIGYASWQSIL
jgi:hypothetical protein